MPATLLAKIQAEHKLREFLREHGIPQPDAVEYGYWCGPLLLLRVKGVHRVRSRPDAGDDDCGPGEPDG
jgi:hypothetical protein